jgi:hypothetical protein
MAGSVIGNSFFFQMSFDFLLKEYHIVIIVHIIIFLLVFGQSTRGFLCFFLGGDEGVFDVEIESSWELKSGN